MEEKKEPNKVILCALTKDEVNMLLAMIDKTPVTGNRVDLIVYLQKLTDLRNKLTLDGATQPMSVEVQSNAAQDKHRKRNK